MNETKDVLKAIRKHEGLTQKQFSDRLGIKQSAYSMIESGTNKPSIDLLKAIGAEFKINPEIFFVDFSENTINDYLTTKNVNPNIIKPVDLNVTESVLKQKGDPSVIVTSEELDDMIKYKLWYMDFYLMGMLYHTGRYMEKAEKKNFDEKVFNKERAYIEKYTGNALDNKPPAYEQMTAKQKFAVLKELDEVTKIMLDKIWLVTRTI